MPVFPHVRKGAFHYRVLWKYTKNQANWLTAGVFPSESEAATAASMIRRKGFIAKVVPH